MLLVYHKSYLQGHFDCDWLGSCVLTDGLRGHIEGLVDLQRLALLRRAFPSLFVSLFPRVLSKRAVYGRERKVAPQVSDPGVGEPQDFVQQVETRIFVSREIKSNVLVNCKVVVKFFFSEMSGQTSD